MTWVFCDILHAWLLVRSGFAALLARWWVGLRTGWGGRPGPGLEVTRTVGGWRPFRVVVGPDCRG